MWTTGALGMKSPATLQRTVWWTICTRFGKRANEENKLMRWDDVIVEKNAANQKYLTLNERITKTRQGDDCHDVIGTIKVFEDKENPDQCPVAIFEKYEEKRPKELRKFGSDFYLQPKYYTSEKEIETDSV